MKKKTGRRSEETPPYRGGTNEEKGRREAQQPRAPSRDYWELVLESYVNHQTDVIFLAGLPAVESRPHSRVNSP